MVPIGRAVRLQDFYVQVISGEPVNVRLDDPGRSGWSKPCAETLEQEHALGGFAVNGDDVVHGNGDGEVSESAIRERVPRGPSRSSNSRKRRKGSSFRFPRSRSRITGFCARHGMQNARTTGTMCLFITPPCRVHVAARDRVSEEAGNRLWRAIVFFLRNYLRTDSTTWIMECRRCLTMC